MSEELCPMESSVLLARRTGQWTETHERHIADCGNCRELLQVAGFMRGIADGLRRDSTLPDPVLVWMKAQWIEREERHRRYLARTASRRALAHAGLLLVLMLAAAGIWSGVAGSIEASISADGVIFPTLVTTFVLLFLGSCFMISRWRRLLVP